jgi:pyruvate/2-oxoglutarate dehydrogenase complex dihydrolipoamide acyltransferase (E2) component
MAFFVKAAVHALKKFPPSTRRSTAPTSSTRLLRYRHRGGEPARAGRADHRDAEALSIAEIEKSIADFGKRAGRQLTSTS